MKESFTRLGFWPMDYRFVERSRSKEFDHRNRLRDVASGLRDRESKSAYRNCIRLQIDVTTLSEIESILGKPHGPFNKPSMISTI